MRGRGGFTLIELVVVIVIGGIVLTWAMPRLDLPGRRVQAAEQQISMALVAAQQRAVMKQHDVRVVFDTAARQLIVHDDANNDGDRNAGETVRVVPLTEGVLFTRVGTPEPTGPAVTFRAGSEGLPVLTFHRGGFGSETGRVFLGTPRVATGHTGDARRLEVDRATGRVRRHYIAGGTWRAHRS